MVLLLPWFFKTPLSPIANENNKKRRETHVLPAPKHSINLYK